MQMEKREIISSLAEGYIAQCKSNCSRAKLDNMCGTFDHKELHYRSKESMRSAISRAVRNKGFNKKEFILGLVREEYRKIEFPQEKSMDEIIKLITKRLRRHELKYQAVRDYLQELRLGNRCNPNNIKRFQDAISNGHSFEHALAKSDFSNHTKKQAKNWFVNEFGGCKRETTKARRTLKKHQYKNLKDFLMASEDSELLSRIWTTIGFIFADGSVRCGSTALVITGKDEYYISKFCLPALLESGVERNSGPAVIPAHSDNHESSYAGSRPVSRLHLECSKLASFLNELGMPSNKIENEIILSDRILSLPDEYFFAFLSGLFAGDGCITAAAESTVHIDFDLHCEKFCNSLKEQIESRLDIPMYVSSQDTKKGRRHFKLSATTSWRALSLFYAMYFHAPFTLKRKTKMAEKRINDLVTRYPQYEALILKPKELERNAYSKTELRRKMALLKKMEKPRRKLQ